MKYFKYFLILIVVLVAGYFPWKYLVPREPLVTVESRPEYKETAYIIADKEGKQISLTVYHSELNQGLHLRSNSELPFEQQLKIVSHLLARALRDVNKASLESLFVGRLELVFGPHNYQFSERLAMAAFRSPQWDKATGKPVSGNVNAFVKELINQAMIYPELQEIFRQQGLKIECISVEKVLLGSPVKYIPFGASLTKQGVKDSDKLPFDCLTWFSVKKL